MDAYEYGFVVKSQKELEELMAPVGSSGWRNEKNEWFDSFVDDMKEYIGEPFFGKPYVFLNKEEGGASNVRAWGWNFDTRWVHELKRCTFEELINSSIPFDKVYACVPVPAKECVDFVLPSELEILYVEK